MPAGGSATTWGRWTWRWSPPRRVRGAPGSSSRVSSVTSRRRVDDRVYAASGNELLAVVRELPDRLRRVALVGHNPGLEDLLELLTGDWVAMPTSAVAVLELPGDWSGAGGQAARLTTSGRPPPPR